jgi:endogenous inhibitor of DNA gyrase (YacG/DUF329 family)
MKCPICKRPLAAGPAEQPFAPFCSERCRLVDLGSWLDGAYRVGAPLSESDLDEGLPTQGDGDISDERGSGGRFPSN